jgi:hypothetical protein
MVGGAIVASLGLLGVSLLDKSSRSLEVAVPQAIMGGFVAHYEAAREAVKAAANAPEPLPGLGTTVTRDIAGSAAGSVAAAFVPAGLAELTRHLASEHGKGDSADARRDAAKDLASKLQRQALLQAHRDLTGRAALAIEPAAFRALGNISEADLVAMRAPHRAVQ